MKKYKVKGFVVDSDNTVSPYGGDITWTLLRTMIRKQKIKKIYGTENTDRKEKF